MIYKDCRYTKGSITCFSKLQSNTSNLHDEASITLKHLFHLLFSIVFCEQILLHICAHCCQLSSRLGAWNPSSTLFLLSCVKTIFCLRWQDMISCNLLFFSYSQLKLCNSNCSHFLWHIKLYYGKLVMLFYTIRPFCLKICYLIYIYFLFNNTIKTELCIMCSLLAINLPFDFCNHILHNLLLRCP